MAEAVAVTLGIGAIQGSRFVLQQYRPKRRLQKWEDKITSALQMVDAQGSKVKLDDLENLMEENALWEDMAREFRTALKDKKYGLFNWKAWFKGKKVWTTAKVVERLAKITSAAAVRDGLTCKATHRTQRKDGCYVCAGREPTSVSMLPESEPHGIPQNELSNIIPVAHETQLPTHVIRLELDSFSTGHHEQGQLPSLSPTVRVEYPSHVPGAPSVIPPADASLLAPQEERNGIFVEDR